MDYTKRRNINRGYMKLEVWNEAIMLLKMINSILLEIVNIDFKLKSQILNAVQSISSNISEGYCRKSINEYLYFLNVSLGSCGEVLTRILGLKVIGLLSEKTYEEIDKLHYSVENKLLALIKSLQSKRNEHTWVDQIHEPNSDYSNIP